LLERVEHSVPRVAASGALSSSLAEDVVSLITTQRKTLQEFCTNTKELYNTDAGETFMRDGLLFVVRCLHDFRLRPTMLTTLEDCCRSANDFYRLMEKMEVLLEYTVAALPFLATENSNLPSVVIEWSELVSLLGQDAVSSAERAQIFIFRYINQFTHISSDLFSTAWEVDLTHNEVTIRLIQVVDQNLQRIETYLDEYLFQKALIVTCKATVCFYIRCLVEKADAVRHRRRMRNKFGHRGERKPFGNPSRALMRMRHDIILIKDFFLQRTKDNATFNRLMADEVYVLELIYECLSERDEDDSLEAFILVIHKRTGANALVTWHLLRDLWSLTNHKSGRKQLAQTMKMMQTDLQLVSTRMNEQRPTNVSTNSLLSFVRLDEMLRSMYEDRVVQGALPLCWTCIPKEEADEGNTIVLAKIRSLSRAFVDMKWKHK
jgi:hypothetical protein